MRYPENDEELEILRATTGEWNPHVEPVLNAEQMVMAQRMVRQVHVSTAILEYVNRLVRSTRPETSVVETVKKYVEWGAGPRAGQALVLASKARALLDGRYSVRLDDVRTLVPPVLRHRILVSFRGQAERVTPDDVAQRLLDEVEEPKSPLT